MNVFVKLGIDAAIAAGTAILTGKALEKVGTKKQRQKKERRIAWNARKTELRKQFGLQH